MSAADRWQLSREAWRPIETAPIETFVLVHDGWRHMVAVKDIECGWMFGDVSIEPTHWMPLPAEPPRRR